MQYNLCDIHFHTNMSFDAYENVNGNILKYDIDNIVDNYINKSTDEVNQVFVYTRLCTRTLTGCQSSYGF